MTIATFQQVTFRIRNDNGSESGATWLANQGDDYSINVDTKFRVRFRVDETTGTKSWTNNTFNLYYQQNSGGFNQVGAATPVQYQTSIYFSDGDDCVERLTGGTGTFVTDNNGMSTDQAVINSGNAGDVFECEFCLQLDSAQVANNDIIELRVYNTTSAFGGGYTDTPVITAINSIRNLTVNDMTLSGVLLDNPAVASHADLTVSDMTLAGALLDNPTLGIDGTDELTVNDMTLAGVLLDNPYLGGEVARVTLEPGNFSEFDSTVNQTDMAVNGTAALVGNYGLALTLDGNGDATYGLVNLTLSTDTLRFRFYFDPNGLSTTTGDSMGGSMVDADGTLGGIPYLWYHRIQNNSGILQHKFIEKSDSDVSYDVPNSGYINLVDAPQYIEVLLKRASSSIASDGEHHVWINGIEQTPAQTAIDNYDLWNTVIAFWFGNSYGADPGTTGTMYYDDLIIRNDNLEIGPASIDNLTVGDFTLAGVLLDNPALGQIHALSVSDTVLSEAVLDNPVLSSHADLSVSDFTLAEVLLDSPVLGTVIAHLDWEEGDFTDATSTVNETDLAVNGTAALVGSYGLSVYQDGSAAATRIDRNMTISTNVLRFRFYIDINSLTMGLTDNFVLVNLHADGTYNSQVNFFLLRLGWNTVDYDFAMNVYDDTNTNNASADWDTSDGIHYIEVRIVRESSDGANDGSATLWIDGSLQETVSGIDNYNIFPTMDELRWGAVSSLDTTTSGTIYLDDFIIRNDDLEIGSAGQDNLTVNDFTLGEAVLDNPALGQIHALSISDTVLGEAVLDNPALSSYADLSISDLLLAEALLDNPTLGQVHALSISDAVLAEAVLDNPALSQIHALSSAEFLLSSVLLDNPALGQIHDLDANDLTLAGVLLDNPVLGQVHELSSSDFLLSSILLDNPVLGQVHVLSSSDLLLNSALLDSPILGVVRNISVNDMLLAEVSLDNPALGQVHELSVDDLLLALALLDNPLLSIVHNLSSAEFLLESILLDNPALGQIHDISISDMLLSQVQLDNPVLGVEGEDNLTVNDFLLSGALLDNPALGQEHSLSSEDFLLASILLDNPALSQIHALSSSDFLLSEIVLDNPTLGVIHNLSISDFLLSSVLLDNPTISQIHDLSVDDLTLASILLDNPMLGVEGEDNLDVNDFVLGEALLDNPALGQVHELSSSDFTLSEAQLDNPTLGVVHNLSSQDIDLAYVLLDNPAIGQIHNFQIDDTILSEAILDNPVISQVHNLSYDGITLAGALLDNPVLSEGAIELSVNDFILSQITLDNPTLEHIHNLSSQDFQLGEIDFANPLLGQTHVLSSSDFLLSGLFMDNPYLNRKDILGVLTLSIQEEGAYQAMFIKEHIIRSTIEIENWYNAEVEEE